MKVIHGAKSLDPALKSSLVTLGNFDGVHLGHRHLLAKLIGQPKSSKPVVVITFDPHPIQVLYPEREFVRISDNQDLEQMLASVGVNYLVKEPFTKDFARIAPEEFMENYLRAPFHPERIVVGYDFAFGHGRAGDFTQLKNYFLKYGTVCEIVQPFKIDGEVVSSRGIRDLVRQGNIVKAKNWLGRHFSLNGEVVAGAGRGKGLGFATLNVMTTVDLLPLDGVYATFATVKGQRLAGVSNVGSSPTFTPDGPIRLECHVFDASLDAYGEKVKIEFVERLRDEIKFTSVDELKAQIAKDVERAKTILLSLDKDVS